MAAEPSAAKRPPAPQKAYAVESKGIYADTTKLCDEGNIERYSAEIINSLGESLSQAISAKRG